MLQLEYESVKDANDALLAALEKDIVAMEEMTPDAREDPGHEGRRDVVWQGGLHGLKLALALVRALGALLEQNLHVLRQIACWLE